MLLGCGVSWVNMSNEPPEELLTGCFLVGLTYALWLEVHQDLVAENSRWPNTHWAMLGPFKAFQGNYNLFRCTYL